MGLSLATVARSQVKNTHTCTHGHPLNIQSHTNTHGEDIAFNFSDITLFSHVSVAELLQDNTFSLVESWQLHWLLNNSRYTYDEKSNNLKIHRH